MSNYAGIDDKYSALGEAGVIIQPVPYDGTSTWGKGSDKGPEAILEASENMELYDIETDSEVYRKGIHLLPPLKSENDPEEMYRSIYLRTKELLSYNKLPVFIGGEHSISIGIIDALIEKYPDLTVLQLDAHSDLRPEYLGTPFNHACAMFRASQKTDLVQVGIRSMDISEMDYLNKRKCFFADDIRKDDMWMDKLTGLISGNIYITIDLDVFDPSIMPSTGTPEPGGLYWNEVLELLRRVIKKTDLIGFDVVELAPEGKNRASDFLAAKLIYKILSYKYYG